MTMDTGMYADLVALGRRARRREVLDERCAGQIIGYDEHGLAV